MLFGRVKSRLVTAEEALPGRDSSPFAVPTTHAVLGTPLAAPEPGSGLETLYVGMGCFWGAERIFWRIPGVHSTAVGYAGGQTPYPTYEEVCTGMTGHTEVVQVVYDPAQVSAAELIRVFWESHDPTQGFRQGNDVGTQYRSVVYTTTPEQQRIGEATRADYEPMLRARGYGPITTEILPAGPFYAAEEYHQQYLHKVPNGYCGIAGTGVSCPIGIPADAPASD